LFGERIDTIFKDCGRWNEKYTIIKCIKKDMYALWVLIFLRKLFSGIALL